MINIDNRKDIKYQVYVSSAMDDKITKIAHMLGLSTMEMVRYFIEQGCQRYESDMKMTQDNAFKKNNIFM